ncbi:uncharacterized protein LOC116298726, partial [Actinia tenebrosa]|uniref:Uncharacterized protein LOC116298726 n=1 Tax=Actinia tenebrosa TaxID=6105 RepID=A0A6P8I3J4_ACTTE
KSTAATPIPNVGTSFGRRSPVYVALPVEQPPFKVRSQQTLSEGNTSKLRAALGGPAEEQGKLITFALKKQATENKSGSESGIEDETTPFVSKYPKSNSTSPKREVNVSNLVMTAEPIGTTNNGAAPSKISLTFQAVEAKPTTNEVKPTPPPLRSGTFVPHFKYFYKHHR